uniref:Uncharacterized protein n=1 Tax=Arundo donax TaxID=35708 RepID=A0A0A9HK60_ARUDO
MTCSLKKKEKMQPIKINRLN